MKRSSRKVSDNTVRRLPRYLRLLCELEAEDRQRVSSAEVGELLGLTASQVRQDFSYFGDFGRQGYGYDIATLKYEIEVILGRDRSFSVAVVGAGNIGRALIENNFFEENGFRVEAAFDVSPDCIGRRIGRVRVFSAGLMDQWLSDMRTDVAALCVPAASAQKAAERLAKLGVRAIWNFTNEDLNLSGSAVVVENIHFSDSLMVIGYRLSHGLPR